MGTYGRGCSFAPGIARSKGRFPTSNSKVMLSTSSVLIFPLLVSLGSSHRLALGNVPFEHVDQIMCQYAVWPGIVGRADASMLFAIGDMLVGSMLSAVPGPVASIAPSVFQVVSSFRLCPASGCVQLQVVSSFRSCNCVLYEVTELMVLS